MNQTNKGLVGFANPQSFYPRQPHLSSAVKDLFVMKLG